MGEGGTPFCASPRSPKQLVGRRCRWECDPYRFALCVITLWSVHGSRTRLRGCSVRMAEDRIKTIARLLKATEEESMSEVQGTKTPGRPWHLWLIGIIGGLWSAMGVMSFMLTRMNVEAVMSRFPPQQREYFESFPLWAVAFWAIGVFGGVLGCLLLLLRNRLAFHVLLASVIGTIVTNLGGLFLLGGMEVMGGTSGLGFTVIPIVLAAFLAYYAHAMGKKRVPR